MTRIRPSNSRSRRGLVPYIAGAVILYSILRAAARAWTDFLWFDSVGFSQVWRVEFFAAIKLGAFATVVAAIVLYGNLRIAGRFGTPLQEEELDENGNSFRSNAWLRSGVRRIVGVVTWVFVGFNALSSVIYRQDYLWFTNREAFGVADAQLGVDVGFYIFTLPLLSGALAWLFQLVVLALIVAMAVHYLNGGIEVLPGRAPILAKAVKGHLSALLAVLVLLRGLRYLLARFHLLLDTGPGEAVFGAGATDVNIRLNGLLLLAGITVVVAVMLIVGARRNTWQLAAIGGGLWLLTVLIVGGAIPALYQRFSVIPDEQVREEQYIARQVEATREAYGLADVEVLSFSGEGALDPAVIEANQATIDNVRLWDPAVLRASYSQLQAIRTYYNFNDVDVDRYVIDGELQQVMLSAREVDSDERAAFGWVTERLVYTHGYGAVVSAANEVDRGNPGYLVKNVPPITDQGVLTLEGTGNQVYFGENHSPSSFLIVSTDQPEVDFPLGGDGDSSFQENTYAGAGGIPIGGFWRQVLFGLKYGDYNILISNPVGDDSKILVERNVVDRVAAVAPYLRVDSDPYLVISEGRLIWMLDLYSVSSDYPYSARALTGRLPLNANHALPNRFNYVRNSVKATVDAKDGTINLYVVDDDDPIIKVQQKIFNESFLHLSDMPESLREHVRYPEDLFRVQSDMYTTFHVTDPQVFYVGEDDWEIPADPSDFPAGNTQSEIRREVRRSSVNNLMVPYYMLMALPDEDDLSYLLLQPFNPEGRPNMSAFLVAQSDPDEYGRLIDYRLPRSSAVSGPNQVKARIDADAEISSQITLWGQQGSTVIRGNMLVVPIEESLLYVQPIYLESESQPIPELRRVVLVYEDEIAMGIDMQEAIGKIFDVDFDSGTDTTPPDLGDISIQDIELLGLIQELFNEAQDALDAGDLGLYQQKIEEAVKLVEEAIASQG